MKKKIFLILLSSIFFIGCVYSFVGNRLTKKVKNFSINLENKTAYATDNDCAIFLEILKRKIKQSCNRLSYVNREGDIHFDIIITKIENSVSTSSSDNEALGSSTQQIKMEIEVTYKNNITGEILEKEKISDHEEIDGDIDLEDDMGKNIKKISIKIIQQIIDKTINEW